MVALPLGMWDRTHLLEQYTLEVVLGLLDERERDRLGDHVDHLPLNNVEVRVDEKLCRRTLESAPHSRGW